MRGEVADVGGVRSSAVRSRPSTIPSGRRPSSKVARRAEGQAGGRTTLRRRLPAEPATSCGSTRRSSSRAAGDPDPPAEPEGEGLAGAARARPDRARSARRAAVAALDRVRKLVGRRCSDACQRRQHDPELVSNETQRDARAEHHATFLDPRRIAASAFTPDPLGSGTRRSSSRRTAASTWALNVVLPGGNKTGDMTLRFVGPSNVLYAGHPAQPTTATSRSCASRTSRRPGS